MMVEDPKCLCEWLSAPVSCMALIRWTLYVPVIGRTLSVEVIDWTLSLLVIDWTLSVHVIC